MAALDLAQFWESDDDSNCSIVIQAAAEDAQTPPAKQARTDPEAASPASHSGHPFYRLPGHTVILKAASPVFKAQLERWVDKGQDGRPELVLEVADQAEADALHNVLRYVYTGALADQGTPTLLLRMLITSDRCDVTACKTACVAALEKAPLPAIADDQLRMLLDLLASTPHAVINALNLHSLEWSWVALAQGRDKPALHTAAQALVQARLGDLDAALADKMLQGRLMALPVGSLLQLLKHDATAAGSEMSAAAAASLWADRNHPDAATWRTLALALRIRPSGGGASASMATATLLPKAPFLAPDLAELLPIVISLPDVHATPDVLRDLGLVDPCTWVLPCRPPSSLKQVEFSWSVTAAQIASVRATGTQLLCPSRHLFQGLWVWLYLTKSTAGHPIICFDAKPPFSVAATCKWVARLIGQLQWRGETQDIDQVLMRGRAPRGSFVWPPGSIDADVTIVATVRQCG